MSAILKKTVAFLLLAGLVVTAAARVVVSSMLPDTFYLAQGEQLRIAALPFVEVEQEQGEALAAGMTPGSSCNLELSLFGDVLALIFAIFTGTVFGFYPAFKASTLIPIEALNQE